MKSYPASDGLLGIVGAGGHAVSVANVALAAGYGRVFFIDKVKRGLTLLGYPILGDFSELPGLAGRHVVIGVGDNAVRNRIATDLEFKYPELIFPALVHASATVCMGVSLGKGTVVMPRAVVGPQSEVGDFCLINTQASIDHDCRMQDFSSLAPAAVTGGAS